MSTGSQRRLTASLYCAAALACSSPGPATHDPVKPPAPAALPSGVTTCDVLGATSPAGTCRLYDTQAKAFAAIPDPLARRAYLYDRWLDLWHKPEGQVVERRTKRAIKPEETESVWSDEALLETYDDEGDSAN